MKSLRAFSGPKSRRDRFRLLLLHPSIAAHGRYDGAQTSVRPKITEGQPIKSTAPSFGKEVCQIHGQGVSQGHQLVVGNRTRAGLDLGNLRARQDDRVAGDPAAQILLGDAWSRRTADFTKTRADQVSGMVWFFALQNVLFEHIDLIIFHALKGACRAHL